MTNLDSVLKNRDVTDRGPSSQSYGFSSSRVWMWELDYKESWALKNSCLWTVVLEKTLESPLDCKEIQPVHPKGDQSWIFIGRTDAEAETPNTWATWCEELTHLKRLWCWERLKVGGKGDDRGWDGWMASPTWWMWVWASSRTRWRTGKPAVLQSMGSQRVGHDWATELNWTCWVVAFSCSVARLCPTLCHPMDCSTLVLLHLPEFAQTLVCGVRDAIQSFWGCCIEKAFETTLSIHRRTLWFAVCDNVESQHESQIFMVLQRMFWIYYWYFPFGYWNCELSTFNCD